MRSFPPCCSAAHRWRHPPRSPCWFARRARQPTWTSEIGWLTVLFGIGQRIGPLLASALSDTPSGVWLGLLVSVAILALAAVIAALQRDAEQRVT